MKKLLSLTLASAMVMSVTVSAMASDTADFPVGGISDDSYAFDEDISAVDLENPTYDFSYGETIYYPLLNTTEKTLDETISNARGDLIIVQNEKTIAEEEFINAKTTVAEKEAEIITATALVAEAKELLNVASAWQDAVGIGEVGAIDIAKAAYEVVAEKHNSTIQVDAPSAVREAVNAQDIADEALIIATEEKITAEENVASTEAILVTAMANVTTKQSSLDSLLSTATPYVHEYDAVDGIRIRDDWERNGKLVDDVDIVKRRIAGGYLQSEKYIYFLAIELDNSTKTSQADIHGVVELRKSGSDGFDYEDVALEVSIEVEFPEADDNLITSSARMFSIGNGFDEDEDDELYFEVDEDSFFTVNTIGQGKLLLSMDSDYNRHIYNEYPKANLDFLNGNGASFNKIGVMSISADRDSYIYRLEDDDSLTLIDTSYDKYDDVHTFRTRHLDSYVISDIELEDDDYENDYEDEDDYIYDIEDDEVKDITNNCGDSNTNPNVNPSTGANV